MLGAYVCVYSVTVPLKHPTHGPCRGVWVGGNLNYILKIESYKKNSRTGDQKRYLIL